jgi:hypothetical protein
MSLMGAGYTRITNQNVRFRVSQIYLRRTRYSSRAFIATNRRLQGPSEPVSTCGKPVEVNISFDRMTSESG